LLLVSGARSRIWKWHRGHHAQFIRSVWFALWRFPERRQNVVRVWMQRAGRQKREDIAVRRGPVDRPQRNAFEGLGKQAGRHVDREPLLHEPARRDAWVTAITRGSKPAVRHASMMNPSVDGRIQSSSARSLSAIDPWTPDDRSFYGPGPSVLAGFSAWCGPVQASSGQVVRHRRNRGGDRQLHRALHHRDAEPGPSRADQGLHQPPHRPGQE
jgi:hypothetical protein